MMRKFCGLLIIGLLWSTSSMAQECPTLEEGFNGACFEACSSDSDCSDGQLCCSNGCGHECMSLSTPDPCANAGCVAPDCNELAAGTITPEGECCPVCACTTTDGSMVAAGTSFMNDCNTCTCGSTGLAYCTLMACLPTTEPTDTDTPPTTLPTTSSTALPTTSPTTSPTMICPNVTNLGGTCDERCSGDDQCSNGQLCCSNGCGHACMDPVLSCAAVSCVRPSCQSPSVLVTPEGSCCPVCGCPTSNGNAVAPGETYQPDTCNTCTCGENGIAACTLAFCPPPTDTTPTTDQSTTSPTQPTDCPVEGQVRVPCGSPCSVTCANMDQVLICPTVCVTNGCQCPTGTVIDEQSNTCVAPSDCPSTGQTQTCPTVQSTSAENCVDECSSDDDCQYDRICCSNGCGGHTCSDSVEMCQLIQCDWPVCEDGAQPVTSPFSCCPYCPTTTTPSGCTASDGTSVDVGETYMDQCNTCRCLEGGVGACTRKLCVGCTLADGSWVEVGKTYKKDCNTCTCSDREVEICTEIACNVGGQDALDGAGSGATVFAGLITTLLCGLLSIFL